MRVAALLITWLSLLSAVWADIPYPFFLREVDVIDGKRLAAEN